jgi:hypothetical protein
MKSIEAYRYRVNNRAKGSDSSDTPVQPKPILIPQNDIPEPVFRPINIKPEYMDDWAEREAILVIDGGLSPDTASLQAACEIADRYGEECLLNNEVLS